MEGRIPFFFVIALLALGTAAHATTPDFCSLDQFQAKEKRINGSGLTRIHGYQLGSVLMMGLGVGDSSISSVSNLQSGKACTWYFNDGNSEATRVYNWRYLNKPSSASRVDQYRDEYMGALQWFLDESASPFWGCIQNQKAIAMGCDGMKHRGPTFFAMVLSFLGCSADQSVAIVNDVWGTNGIPVSVRTALSQAALEYGDSHPALRQRALARFTGKR